MYADEEIHVETVAELNKKFKEEKLTLETTITELRGKLDQLDEFKTKRDHWIEQEEAHKADKTRIIDDYEVRLVKLMEAQKNNEIRWADDIRKQRERMHEEVRTEIQNQTTLEVENMSMEHAQMGLDLKHQASLMKTFMAESDKRKERVEELENELVVARTVQASFIRKLRFVTRRMKIYEKQTEILKMRGFVTPSNKKGGVLFDLDKIKDEDDVNIKLEDDLFNTPTKR